MDSHAVRRCRPGEARAEVEALWERNLTLEQSAAEKFARLYERAPHPPETLFLLDANAPSAPPRVIGTAGVGIRELAVNQHHLRAGLLADLAVDREHRTVAPALRLVREVKAWALDELDLAYGFPNPHAEGVFKRVGYTLLGDLPRYVRVLRHRSYLDRIGDAELSRLPTWLRPLAHDVLTSKGWSQKAAVTAVDLAQLGRDLGFLVAARRQEHFSVTDEVPAGVDALWQRCRSQHAVVSVRSQRMLEWRYPAHRGRWWAAARSGSRLDAYAIVDRVGEVAHIRDLFGGRVAMESLLRQLVFECYRRGAASISMRYLGDRWMSDLLRLARFDERKAHRRIFVGVSPKLERRLQAMLVDPACWFITDFDEDT
jgi:hypothetical protein